MFKKTKLKQSLEKFDPALREALFNNVHDQASVEIQKKIYHSTDINVWYCVAMGVKVCCLYKIHEIERKFISKGFYKKNENT